MASIKLKGDTSGEVTISAPSVAGTTTLELPATSSTLATQNSLGVRNLIINGDMQIAQRGTSETGITGTGYYTVDRYLFAISGQGTWTNTQSTDVPTGQGFANSYKLECTTADASPASGDVINLQYRIEAQNCQYLNYGTSSAKTTTLSFWVKSNKTGTYNFNLRKDDDNRRIVKQYTISSADTWEKKTITIEGDTTGAINNDNGIGLQLVFWLGAGSNFTTGSVPTGWSVASDTDFAPSQVNLADSTSNYINITGVQLEVGTEATPFEHRPYDMELQRCQRYFQEIAGFVCGTGSGSTQCGASVMYKTEMRASPSVGLTAALQVTRVANADFTQSAANVVIAASGARVNTLSVSLDFSNFTGLPSDAALPAIVTGGILNLSSEL